jgi:hypothetical protein
LNSPCDKNASAVLWKREPISDDYLPSMHNKKWRSTSWLTMFNSLFSSPTWIIQSLYYALLY